MTRPTVTVRAICGWCANDPRWRPYEVRRRFLRDATRCAGCGVWLAGQALVISTRPTQEQQR